MFLPTKNVPRYPRLCFYLDRVRGNAARVTDVCCSAGISVYAVTKGACADLRVAKAMSEGGCEAFADSRIQNLASLRRAFPDKERLLIRTPMRCELGEVVQNATCSAVSMVELIEALETECATQKLLHDVLLMFDLGDRREGILEHEMSMFVKVFKRCTRVRLRGVGVNFGCFAGTLPSASALERLLAARDFMESGLGYNVPICSGGATSTLKLLEDGQLPQGINQLRIGGAVLMAGDSTWLRNVPWLRKDTMVFEAQIVEIREKPPWPEGPLGRDAPGRARAFVGSGRRLRAVLAVGHQDIPMEGLTPLEYGVNILGCSSDHMILDVTDSAEPLKWGDVLHFGVGYDAMLGLTTSPYICRTYFEGDVEV